MIIDEIENTELPTFLLDEPLTETELLKALYDQQKQGEDFLNSLPDSVMEAFMDNPLINNLNASLWDLMNFSGLDVPVVSWVLYCWFYSPSDKYVHDGEEYSFDSIDQLCEFLREKEGWS